MNRWGIELRTFLEAGMEALGLELRELDGDGGGFRDELREEDKLRVDGNCNEEDDGER